MGKLDMKKEEEAYVSSHSDKKKYSYNRKTYDGNRFRTDKRIKADYVPTEKKGKDIFPKGENTKSQDFCENKY